MPSYGELQRLHVADAMARLPGQVERLGWSAELAAVGLRDAEVTVTPVDHLARQGTGKLKRFIPLKPALVGLPG